MDYTIHIPNSNHAVSNHFNFTTSPIHLPTNAGRKRTRSNSQSKSEHAQKTARLLSPPRFRGIPSQSFPSSQFSCWNENWLSFTSSIGDLSNKTQTLAVQDTKHVDLMDCDNMPINSDDDEIIQHITSSSPTRGQRQQHRQTQLPQLPFTMGRRLDCEKCRLRVPGHFSHVISH